MRCKRRRDMGAHMPVQSERLAPLPHARTGRGSTRPCSWPRDAASRRGPWPRLSARLQTASRPWCGDCGNARQEVRAEAGGPLKGGAGRPPPRRHRPAPRRHRARGRRPAGRPMRRQAALAELLEGRHRPLPAAPANSNRPVPQSVPRPGGLTDAIGGLPRQRRQALTLAAGQQDWIDLGKLCRRSNAPELEPITLPFALSTRRWR